MSEYGKRFVIGNNQEEFECPTCGCPLYVGDRAILIRSDTLETEYTTCSWTCHAMELRDHERMELNNQHNAVNCEA